MIWHQGGQIPSLASSPHPSRSHPYSKQAPHFPASSCSRAFFLIPQVPIARRKPGGLRAFHHNHPDDRNGQGSRGSPVGTQRRNSPAHSEFIGISHFPHLRIFAAVRIANSAPQLQGSGPARPDPSPCLDFEGRHLFLIVKIAFPSQSQQSCFSGLPSFATLFYSLPL